MITDSTIVGLDVGGSKTAIVEGTTDARILQRTELRTEAARPFAETWPLIARIIEETMRTAGHHHRTVRAISVSIGGPLRIQSGELLDPPHLPGWHGIPLTRTIAERFPALPVHVEHDGNAGALAEWRFGVGRTRRNLRHIVFLTCGTGLGAGIIANGAILHGASDLAGEVGFWRVAAVERGRWTEGSWDNLASGTGLLAHARVIAPNQWGNAATVADVVAAALDGEPSALAAVECTGRWLGRGLALLVAAFNPEIIVVGTLGVVLGELLLGPAREALLEDGLPAAVAACEVLEAGLGSQLGDVASLMAGIEATRESGGRP